MPRVRAGFVLTILTLVTLTLIPVQWAAVRTRRPLARRLPVLWHRIACALVGIRVIERGRPASERPLLVTANHASWIDITVLGSRMPLSFIAKSEVAGWPVFGLFARLQRTVFVDRQRRSETGRVAREIGARLVGGDAMVLFAEGTSNDGNGVLPFRSALIGAARHALGDAGAEVYVQPLSIAYTRLQGLPMGRQFRPHVAWYGDMEMIGHFLAVCRDGAIDVELTWGQPVPVGSATDRKELTRYLESTVREMTAAVLSGREPAVADGKARLFSSGEKTVKAGAA
ncbi:1-acyl-sn-glycerol-3-phosphate acyltransferase [Stappia sp. F7233]|uniref:1-acyl-sn-glycerol-3-phosphate acyltransferase n=1 Tax=Stappia albiluteola TaxID=2758565 RepID=A0A839A903_9HYPH|nr:lysophospholipid acyltransferase family protein [Stappia albiluteola]MBA5776080.1 1-acyl-sn-glycerol-3-phosphate acyltransferase [Stappia albiluteola]